MHRSWLAYVLLVACAAPEVALPEAESARVLPEPATDEAPRDDANLHDAACMRCHVEAARSWEGSAHHSAFTNEIFQAEWAPRRQAACVRCHAPLADAEAPQGDATLNGISCAVCHVREGSVLASHASPDAPHPITVDDTLSTSTACAGCHDFTFASVAPTPYAKAEMLQGTMREWHEVQERGTCQHCHMAEGSHAMPGARDATLLSHALHVEALAHVVHGHTEVTLTLTSLAGHAVPTGDMFRRLQVEAWPVNREAARVSTTLMRHFERRDGALHQVRDERVPAQAPREVSLTLPRTRRVAWRITWQALDPRLAEAHWIPDEDAARVVAEGVVEVR